MFIVISFIFNFFSSHIILFNIIIIFFELIYEIVYFLKVNILTFFIINNNLKENEKPTINQ